MQKGDFDSLTSSSRKWLGVSLFLIRKWLGVSLFLIPICLAVLILQPNGESEADAETASENRAVSFTAVQVAPPKGVQAEPNTPTDVQAGPNSSDQLQTLEQQRVIADELRRALAIARTEVHKVRAQAVAAQAVAEEQRQLAARERGGNAALQAALLEDARALRESLDALLRAAGTREENLRRELGAANQDLADMQRISANVGTQSALMATALEDQRKSAEEAARGLAMSQRELKRVKAESMAGHKAVEASLATTMHALEDERRKVGLAERELAAARRSIAQLQDSVRLAATEERRKVELAERDLAAARQSIKQLEASAQLASKKQADLLQSVQLAEAAAKEAGEALERERERASALAHDLETAHRERIVTQQELERVLVVSNQAVDQEREKAIALTRDLASARKEIDALMRRASRRVTKASAVADVNRRPAQRRSEPKSQLPKAITLPNALRPTRPPVEGSLQ